MPLKKLICLALCLVTACAFALPAFALDEEDIPEAAGLIDPEELNARLQDFLKENKLSEQNVSIGYYYSGTDESWYFNENEWCYGASLYKAPLMMYVAGMVTDGTIPADYTIGGLDLPYLQETILTYSNNDYAHMVLDHFWPDNSEGLKLMTAFSDLPEEEYPNNYFYARYFSARYMTDVFKTLYHDPDRFPGVLECLKNAQPEHYFRAALEGKYDVAQKYGSLNENNHTAGIIYTPNPIVLTVMTRNLSITGADRLIGELAQRFTDYTLELDERLAQYKAEQERLALEAEAAANAEAEKNAAPEQADPASEPAPAGDVPVVQPAAEADSSLRKDAIFTWGVPAIAGLAALLLLASALGSAVKKRRDKRRGKKKTHEYSR